ncbi:uncharacterized protein SOCE26_084710 [Sorangium cellulosum]|uniref:Lipoprotein n=1 Tax=Sorangium cellulosum TaxID=56 RepID=A0A2L0F636_SORCE|nr:hypothetical protein [Sorangium cellulosum]AUX46961.1 uncharacterized protein SOCE26_084710 [Sorangium cellulosum]
MKFPRPFFSGAHSALGVLALGALSGCASYVSDYVPPADGRARPVFRGGEVVMEVGGGDTPECLTGGEEGPDGAAPPPPPSASSSRVSVRGGFWVPVYYGPPIVVVRRGVAPPRPHIHRAPGSVVRVPASPSKGGSAGTGGSATPRGSGARGSGGGSEAVAVVLVSAAVLALAALPAVAVGLSFGRTEAEEETALTLDRVNAYNDLTRTPGSQCAAATAGRLSP